MEVVRVRIQLAQYDDNANRWRRSFNRLFRPNQGERYECLVLPRPGTEGRSLLVRFITDTIETRRAIAERGAPQQQKGRGPSTDRRNARRQPPKWATVWAQPKREGKYGAAVLAAAAHRSDCFQDVG
jgi:hypothetical protein